MATYTKAHKLSDGTTIKVRTERTIAGTVYTELPSRKRNGTQLMRLGTSMFLVLRENMILIRHPEYAYAADDKSGADVALRFWVDSAEAVIAEAAKDGGDVADYYAKV